MVFIFGGLGPMHSDVSVAGVAKAFGVRLAADEEFEEYLRHLIGDHCTGDRNEMALLPEGITELLHNDVLPVPLVHILVVFLFCSDQCRNVIVLTSTNVTELDKEWDCLLTLPNTPLVQMAPFSSKHLSTMLSDVEAAQTVAQLCLDFPDIYIGSHRRSRAGPLIISFVGKDQERIDLAAAALSGKFPLGAFNEYW
ncbi:unnamed protein product [Spirodela intermedia]|uniref:Uncharacterized protein n=1 Tax=Spirodela intermedia TaxID=51605 RepID=A0A7I8IYM1_SPIIN|nr:unnamed protein product [Spirodela intermedia]CAA6662812.1 unnamed protein product [Spirodela intermedia]